MDKFVLRKNITSSSEVESSRNISDENEEDAPSLEIVDDVSAPSTETLENPWPYINPFFKYIKKNGSNLEFKCKNCISSNSLSTNHRSLSNLRRHMQRKHSSMMKQFESSVKEGTIPSTKKRCIDEVLSTSEEAPSSSKKRSHQPSIGETISRTSKVSREQFQSKVSNE